MRAETDVALPLYDRKTHDPVPGALRLDASHTVVFCEGNFLYLDTPRWRAVAQRLDVRLFVKAPAPLAKKNLFERFRRGGKNSAQIAAHWSKVDARNVEDIAPGAGTADLIFEKDEANTLRGIRV